MEKRNLKVTILIFVDMIFGFSRPHHYHQFVRYCYMTVLSMIMYSKGEKKNQEFGTQTTIPHLKFK